MNKKLQLGLFTAVFLIIVLGAYVIFINSNKTPSQNPALITYLVSLADPARYCNGADLDSAGYQKTIIVKKATSTAEINSTKLQIIKTVINAGTTGMCRRVMNQLNLTENNGTVYIPPIDGWAGESIVMCSCQPQVEVNLLQIPGITKVVWSTTVTKADSIRLATPLPNQTINSPLVIKGQAKGSWFFEASFPVVLTDWDGRIIAQGVAQANPPTGGDWLTTEFVPFEAKLVFTVDKNAYSNKGSLILKKDNPSGLPQNDDSREIPIVFAGINSGGNNSGGISGYLHLGPVCPVEKNPPDPNCADRPFANATVDVTVKSSGVLAGSAKSDVSGNFRVNLPPTTYLIKTRAPNNSILPRCEQKEAVVVANKFINLDISCDTGIR